MHAEAHCLSICLSVCLCLLAQSLEYFRLCSACPPFLFSVLCLSMLYLSVPSVLCALPAYFSDPALHVCPFCCLTNFPFLLLQAVSQFKVELLDWYNNIGTTADGWTCDVKQNASAASNGSVALLNSLGNTYSGVATFNGFTVTG
jgi:hypothetical protein